MLTKNFLSTIKVTEGCRSFVIPRHFILAVALGALSACESIDPLAAPIGQPSRSLIAEGEGAIVNSLAYSMPYEKFRQNGPLITQLHFEPLDVGSNRFWLGNGRRIPKLMGKGPHATNETLPYIFVHSLKPGKYRLDRIAVGASHSQMQTHQLSNAPVITVVAGQITYVGNFMIKFTTGFDKGDIVVRYAQIAGPNNEFERDIGQLKSAEKTLENVIVVNAAGQ